MTKEQKAQIESNKNDNYSCTARISWNILLIIISIAAGISACIKSKNIQNSLSAGALIGIFFITSFIMVTLFKTTELLTRIIEGLCHRKDIKKCNKETLKGFKNIQHFKKNS